MPPYAINSFKKKRSKCKGPDASSRAGLPKKSHQTTDLPKVLSILLVFLGLAEAEDSTPQCSSRPNAVTRGRSSQLEKIGAVLESQSQSCPPKGFTSLSPNISAIPPPYSSLIVTNGPVDIDDTGCQETCYKSSWLCLICFTCKQECLTLEGMPIEYDQISTKPKVQKQCCMIIAVTVTVLASSSNATITITAVAVSSSSEMNSKVDNSTFSGKVVVGQKSSQKEESIAQR
ncbi:hypothetical protein BDR07DRAFT_1372493 [Suillus spraguei]|nr:hypothetical protein BDR07DRAFT_1372493 [Suillus spraguei]